MVHQIVRSKYRDIVESLILTLLIFLIGFSIGFYIENYRTDKIINDYKSYEVSALDLRLQNYYYQIMSKASCDSAIAQNFAFADKIYDEGLVIEKYEEANQITDNIILEKKRYVLLKTELWLNTVLLKAKCNNPFDSVVYIYSNDPKNTGITAEQKIISNVLKEVKDKMGNKIILIPIAGDMGLEIVDMQLGNYNITSLPAILINENKTLYGYHSVDEIVSYLRK